MTGDSFNITINLTNEINGAYIQMKEKKKLPGAIYIVIGTLILTVVLIIGIFQIYVRSIYREGNARDYDKYYVMIVGDQKSDFWQAVYKGAYEAGQKQNVYVDLLGTNLAQNYDRYELMDIATYSNVDGIIVEANETLRMKDLIDRAVDNGIPVITLYGDNTDSKRCSYVGIGNYDLGREYGRQVLDIADGRQKNVAVLVSAQANNSSQNIVWSGIQETILQEGKQKDTIHLSLVSVDDSSTFTVEESIRDLFMQESLPDIIICLNAVNTTCVYQAVIDYNKVGEIDILGYYNTDTILKAIERSVITSTIAVDTEQMGRYCIEALTEYEQLGNTSEYFMADITLIDEETVSEFRGGEMDD